MKFRANGMLPKNFYTKRYRPSVKLDIASNDTVVTMTNITGYEAGKWTCVESYNNRLHGVESHTHRDMYLFTVFDRTLRCEVYETVNFGGLVRNVVSCKFKYRRAGLSLYDVQIIASIGNATRKYRMVSANITDDPKDLTSTYRFVTVLSGIVRENGNNETVAQPQSATFKVKLYVLHKNRDMIVRNAFYETEPWLFNSTEWKNRDNLPLYRDLSNLV